MNVNKKSKSKKVTGFDDETKPTASNLVDSLGFVMAWNESSTLKSLAESLGVSASTCAAAAARLRKLGHELKWFRKGRPRRLTM